MYADVLTCLPRDPLAGNVSPALLGTAGTVPLSIVSTIPDIMSEQVARLQRHTVLADAFSALSQTTTTTASSSPRRRSSS